MIANRVDANQAEIVAVLRDLGATVQPLNAVGKGCPDLLVGYNGRNYLMEVKDGNKSASRQKLTTSETKWIAHWHGATWIVHSAEEAINALRDHESEIPFYP